MALSRMHKLFEFCPNRNTVLFQNQFIKYKFPKNVRNFRRGKINEESKINPGSLETPFSNVTVESANLSAARLWKPFLFTVGFSGATFLGCAIWEYENMRTHAINMLKKPVNFYKRKTESGFEKHAISKEVKKWWDSLSQGEKVFLPICVLNIVVFGMWRVPRLQPFMIRYFASNPASQSQCLPMLLSTFSHYSGFHLLANMYVLHSFSTGAVHSLGKEQFLGLYLASGVISSFTSYLYKIITKQPGLSLGASGAIMAILGYVCTQYPDTRLGIILLPFFTFSAGAAIKVIVGLDTAGVLFGWKFFDHAAHLGGAATGIFWAVWGSQHMWSKREPVLQYWHDIRGSIK